MNTVIMNSGWTYKPTAPLPTIWEGKYGKYYTRCPTCHRSRSHKSRGLAIDKGHFLCRKCRIERGSDYWAILRLTKQEAHAKAKQALEDEL